MKVKTILLTIALTLTAIDAFAVKFDSDVPEKIKNQMLADLQFMNQIQGDKQTPMHNKVFGAVSGPVYTKFFESRVLSVGLDSCGGGGAVACVMPFFDENKMWLTQNFIKFEHPQVARMMVVFHEARHTEGNEGNWMHARCPVPFLDEQGREMKSIWTGQPLAGEAACDITAYGSYGSSTIMLKNISKYCKNCNDKVKMDADIYATDQLGRISRPDVKKEMLADFNAR